MLPLIPGGADAEHGPAAGQHVQGRDDLGEQPRSPVGDTGDEQAERDPAGLPGEVAQTGVALRHGLGRGAELLHLEPVIHHAEPGAANVIRGPGGRGERRGQVRGAAGQGEVGEVDA